MSLARAARARIFYPWTQQQFLSILSKEDSYQDSSLPARNSRSLPGGDHPSAMVPDFAQPGGIYGSLHLLSWTTRPDHPALPAVWATTTRHKRSAANRIQSRCIRSSVPALWRGFARSGAFLSQLRSTFEPAARFDLHHAIGKRAASLAIRPVSPADKWADFSIIARRVASVLTQPVNLANSHANAVGVCLSWKLGHAWATDIASLTLGPHLWAAPDLGYPRASYQLGPAPSPASAANYCRKRLVWRPGRRGGGLPHCARAEHSLQPGCRARS